MTTRKSVKEARAWAGRMVRRDEAKRAKAAAERSAAARKGWATRRAKAKGRIIWEESPAAKETQRRWLPYSQPNWVTRGRPMLAADLGLEPPWWQTVITDNIVRWDGFYWTSVDHFRKTVIGQGTGITDLARGLPPDPNPWPRIAAWVRRIWQRITWAWR